MPRQARLLIRAELAAAFATHMQTVTKWEREGMPIARRGSRGRPSQYSLPSVVAWYVERELQARGVAGGPIGPLQERALLDKARRDEIELRLQLKRGEVVPARQVELTWTRHVAAARNHLLGLPTRARQRLPHLTRPDLAVLDDLVRQSLEQLADGRPGQEAE